MAIVARMHAHTNTHTPVAHAIQRASSSAVGIVTPPAGVLAGGVSVPGEVGLGPGAHLLLALPAPVVVQLLVVVQA